jgi:hypothetical protein
MTVETKTPGWLARNDFRLLRFIFAIILFWAVSIPLARNGMTLVGKEFNSLTAHTKTVTLITPITSASTDVGPQSAVQQPSRAEGLSPTKTEKTEESTSPQVWAYLAQLLAWAAMLGMSLWAIVALCREE